MRWWEVGGMVIRENTTWIVSCSSVTHQSHQLVPQLLHCFCTPLHKKNDPKKPRRKSDRYRLWSASTSSSPATENSSIITGRYCGQRRPDGSSLGSLPADCCWAPSDRLWRTRCFCFRSSCGQLHASPDWIQSSLPGPAGGAGSSHCGNNNNRVIWIMEADIKR